MCTLNVTLMVDTDSPAEVYSVKEDSQGGERRKVDLIVNKVKKYGVKVAV